VGEPPITSWGESFCREIVLHEEGGGVLVSPGEREGKSMAIGRDHDHQEKEELIVGLDQGEKSVTAQTSF